MAKKIKKSAVAVKQKKIKKSTLKSNNAKIDDNEFISISLKYFYGKPECFSKWNKKELKKFQNTINKLRKYTEKTITKDNSLNYKEYKLSKKQMNSVPKRISYEIISGGLHGLRGDGKVRLYGYMFDNVFILYGWIKITNYFDNNYIALYSIR